MNCKLNYVDIDSKVIITVKDFSAESIPLYYTREIDGGRIIYCSECGKLVLITNSQDTSRKYCKKCCNEKAQEVKNEYHRRTRSN